MLQVHQMLVTIVHPMQKNIIFIANANHTGAGTAKGAGNVCHVGDDGLDAVSFSLDLYGFAITKVRLVTEPREHRSAVDLRLSFICSIIAEFKEDSNAVSSLSLPSSKPHASGTEPFMHSCRQS